MSQSSQIKVILIPKLLSIDLDIDVGVLLEFRCGSHQVLSQKQSQMSEKQCYFQSQQLEIVTTMKYKNGKFKEKEAKVRIILLHKNNYKRGGKVKFDLGNYMNQKLKCVDDKIGLINCPDKNASLSFQIQFKQAIQVINKLQTQPKFINPIQQICSISPEIEDLKSQVCQSCLKLQEQIKQLNSQLQPESQRSTISQRDSLQQTKFQMLENEIKCQYQVERELKTIIEILEIELLKQKKIVAHIMQEFLQLGDPKLIELVETVIQCY